MAPKKNARDITPTAATAAAAAQASAPAPAPASQSKPKKSADSWDKVLQNIYNYYIQDTPQRTKLIDVFLVFLVAVGALQFLYCVLAGNYVGSPGASRETHRMLTSAQPFNAFLSGFSATVGQFVLTGMLFVCGFKERGREADVVPSFIASSDQPVQQDRFPFSVSREVCSP